MSDNSQLIPGTSGGDYVRMVDRGAGFKEQVVVLDLGGPNTNGENLLTGEFPVRNAIESVTGSITVGDSNYPYATVNSIVNTAPTANSFVPLQLKGGEATVTFTTLGNTNGVHAYDISQNSTNGSDGTWTGITVRQLGTDYKQSSTTGQSQVIGSCAGGKWIRVRGIAGSFSPATAVTIFATVGASELAVTLNSETTKNIGTVTVAGGGNSATIKAASAASVATDTALVVALSPNSATPNTANSSVTGSISAVDSNLSITGTTGAFVTGTPTAGSYVSILLKGGENQVALQLGPNSPASPITYYTEFSPDTTDGVNGNWYASFVRRKGVVPNAQFGIQELVTNTPLNPALYTGQLTLAKGFRVRALGSGSGSGSTSVLLSVGTSLGATIDGSLSNSYQIIGRVGVDQTSNGFSNRVVLGPVMAPQSITTTNANPNNGTPTFGSYVNSTILGDASQLSINVAPGFVGTLNVQVSSDNQNWETNTLATAITRTATGAQSATITGPGVYEYNAGGSAYARVSCSALTTGSTVTLWASNGIGTVALDAPIPADVGLASINNSTSTVLGSSAAFTGTSDDALHYPFIAVSVFADQASATDGLSMQQSSNGTNWDVTDVFTVPAMTAGQGKTYSVSRTARYFRVVYTNGATTQTAFRLQTMLSRTNSKASSVRPQDLRGNDNDMEEVASYPHGYDAPSNTWSRLRQKPASTAAAATDPALVVTLSPNNAASLQLFNGATYDPYRNNFNTTTGDTGAKTATFNGATQTNYNARGAAIVFQIGAVSGTSPTLVLKLQNSLDGGTTWVDIPGAATASITAASNVLLTIFPGAVAVANSVINQLLPRNWRVVGTIGGTTPSFTITQIMVGYVN